MLNTILAFSWNYFTFKNWFIMKNKISSNRSNIYIYGWNPLTESFPNLEIVSSYSTHNSRNCSPKFGTVLTVATTPSSNDFQYVRCWRNPRIQLRSSRRGLHLSAFIRWLDLRFTVNRQIFARLRRGSSSPVSFLHCYPWKFFVFVLCIHPTFPGLGRGDMGPPHPVCLI
jgi:hypothetical protein